MTNDIKQLEVADEKPPSLCNLIRDRVCGRIINKLSIGRSEMGALSYLPSPNIVNRFRHEFMVLETD